MHQPSETGFPLVLRYDLTLQYVDVSYMLHGFVVSYTKLLNLQTGSDWLYVYPRGILDLLLYTKNKFNDPIIYITENGSYNNRILTLGDPRDNSSTIDKLFFNFFAGVGELNTDRIIVEDNYRIRYFNDHLSFLNKAIM